MKGNVYRIGVWLATILTLCSGLAGCRYDVKPNLPCDTSNVTYSGTVSGIIQSYGCLAPPCHGSAGGQAGFSLSGYPALKAKVTDGRLFGAINHFSGFIPMPQNEGKMDPCDIDKIRAWIDQGAPDN